MVVAVAKRCATYNYRLFVLTEANYGNYWQFVTERLGVHPLIRGRVVPYVSNVKSPKFIMTNSTKVTLCGTLRGVLDQGGVCVEAGATLGGRTEGDADALRAQLVAQLRLFYEYRIYHRSAGIEGYSLQLTGKHNKSLDDLVICAALFFELLIFANRAGA